MLILSQFDKLDLVDTEGIVRYVSALQQPDGSFLAEEGGEVDTRHSYAALSCLKLLNAIDSIDKDKALEYVLRCKNIDGAFGQIPGAESHAAYVFCCVGAIGILEALDVIDRDQLGFWLSQR